MVCQLETIPGEILLNIARLLGYRDLCTIALVCRLRWWKVASDPLLWKSFQKEMFWKIPKSEKQRNTLENLQII